MKCVFAILAAVAAVDASTPFHMEDFPTVVNGLNMQVGMKTDDAAVTKEGEAPRGEGEAFQFQADVNKLMDIIINSLYSKKEIFLRELVSNGSDALDKVRFMSLTDPSLLGEGDEAKLEIQISVDKEAKTLTVRDRGIGMTKEDLITHLGTVAQSGTSSFIEAFSEGADVNLIGQFGVGFYSVYLVADTVTVTSKAGDDEQYIWESSADSTFTIYKDPAGNTLGRGTAVTLHLKEDCLEFLEDDRLKTLVKRYSEFVNFPIYLQVEKTEEEEVADDEEEEETEGEEEEKAEGEEDTEIEDAGEEEEEEETKTKTIKKTVQDWELLNDAKAIWTRSPKDVTDDEYNSFYKALTKDFTDPFAHIHFQAEGEVEFKSILYVPKEAPWDLYQDYYKKQSNIKLYVRRVMITEEFDELLPRYLGFIKGIVDSDSLPLNVSREMLQQNKVLKVIGKKMTRKALAMIKSIADADKGGKSEDEEGEEKDAAEVAEETPEGGEMKYETFWKNFGKYIKMGLIEDASNRTRLAKLLRYYTSKSGEKQISLEQYVENMPESQKNIYYISGEDKETLEKAPAVEKLLAKGVEVVYMTDSVDEYALQHLTEYEGKRLINASREGLKLDDENDEDRRREDKYKEMFTPVIDFAKDALGKHVEKVVVSKHLYKSACTVVSADYGWTAQMEKVMKSQAFADNSKFEFMKSKRILEINPRHPLIIELNKRVSDTPDDESLKDMVNSLYMSSLLQAGYQTTPEESAFFSEAMSRVIHKGLDVAQDAVIADEIEVPEEEEEEAEEEEAEEAESEEEEATEAAAAEETPKEEL